MEVEADSCMQTKIEPHTMISTMPKQSPLEYQQNNCVSIMLQQCSGVDFILARRIQIKRFLKFKILSICSTLQIDWNGIMRKICRS
mmetsp:Transcript_5548/g.13516  ORF Transcript_5548/g.13516 Transcript_5548/m.13516 type:complete len:86 (+) Transcript_5548:31-288(+)